MTEKNVKIIEDKITDKKYKSISKSITTKIFLTLLVILMSVGALVGLGFAIYRMVTAV